MNKLARHNRTERLAALAILIAVVGGFMAITIGLGFSMFEREKANALSVARTIDRIRQAVESQLGVVEGLGHIDEAQLSELAYISAPTTAVAVATLQDRLGVLATQSEANIRRVIVTDGAGGQGEISIQIQITGTLDQVSSFVVAVETSRPLLRIGSLNIASTRARASARRAVEPTFSGTFTVSAYVRMRETDGV